jgi:hypothetical protein
MAMDAEETSIVEAMETMIARLRQDATADNGERDDAISKMERLIYLYRDTVVCPTCQGSGHVCNQQEA